jgi:MFS family permease
MRPGQLRDRLTPDSPPVTLRSVAASAFLPAFVYEIGNGAIAPINALAAVRCGASAEVAALMLALPGIGMVLGDVPSAALAGRLGDRRAMTLAAGGAMVALLACFLARSLYVLGPALLLIGMCNATYYLGRQAYLLEVIPVMLRARAMSTLGGAHRIGLFCGPFVGAGVIALFNFRAAYLLALVCAAAAAGALLLIPDVERNSTRSGPNRAPGHGLRTLLRERRRMLLTLGTAVFALSALRAVRQIAVPLWAVHIGLGAEQTSIIFGIASAVDMALFYPAGKVMDRFGRLAIAIPSPLILGATMVLLPLSHGAVTLTVVAVLMSVGNGIGSGIQMTIGADLAPVEGRLGFLSLWRVWADTGNASGPLVLSAIAAVLSLGAGVVGIGLFGAYAAVAMRTWLPRYSPLATRASIRAHAAREVPATPECGPAPPGYGGAPRSGAPKE